CALQGHYDLFPIPPHEPAALRHLLERVRAGEIHGLNVTIPHKQTVLSLLDDLTPSARAIGAVNTIYQRDSVLVGDNTDAPGFYTDLMRFLASLGGHSRPAHALVLGAGGSARAVVYALLTNGWQVTLSARRPEQAHALAADFAALTGQPLSVISLADLAALPSFDAPPALIVNTTPLGMHPHTDQSPWPSAVPFPPNAAVYDLVYNPRETLLLQQARAAGLPAISGLGMLIEQAALAFQRWTDCAPPRQPLWQALLEPR
ncbi:MAG: shikimate dehydrogenase, partial [Anaerolineales bacterium]